MQFTAPQPELQRPGWNVWWMSAALCLMFMGMTHDFRSAGMSQQELFDKIVDSVAAVHDDVNAAIPERKAGFLLSGLIAVYCWLSARRSWSVGSSALLNLILAALLWTAASFLWSDDPPKTARELFRLAVFAGLASGLAVRFTMLELVWILMLTACFSIGAACVGELLHLGPLQDGEAFRLAGTLHPNQVARFGTLAAVTSLGFALRSEGSRWKFWLILFAALSVIQLTRSRTSLLCCMMGMATVTTLVLGARRVALPLACFLIALSMGVLVIGIGGDAALKGSAAAANMGRADDTGSLNGRLPLWESVLDRMDGHVFGGYGFGAFWSAEMNESIRDEILWLAGHAHNVFLETAVGTGLIGALLVASVLACAAARAFSIAHATGAVEYQIIAAIIVAATSGAFTTSAYIQPRELAIVSGTIAFAVCLTPAHSIVRATRPYARQSFPHVASHA